MKELVNPLLTTKYTRICHENEDEIKFNAPHHFVLANAETGFILQEINFQEGPIKEYGINGIANEDALVMVLTRLQGFQNSEYSCKENAMAITKIEEALLWLRKRTMGREQRGVEGTNEV